MADKIQPDSKKALKLKIEALRENVKREDKLVKSLSKAYNDLGNIITTHEDIILDDEAKIREIKKDTGDV